MQAHEDAEEAMANAYHLAEATAEALKLQFDLTWTKASLCTPESEGNESVVNGCIKAFNTDVDSSASSFFPILFINIDIRGLPLTNSASLGGPAVMMLNLGPTMEEVLQEASELTGKEVKLVAEGNSGGGALVAALAWAESVA